MSIPNFLRGGKLSAHRGATVRIDAGFTVVELLIVIAVVGILAALIVVGYNGLAVRAIEVSMKSDLQNAASVLELANKADNGYPADSADASTLNNGSGLQASENNTLAYESRPYGYCVAATSSETDAVFHVKSHDPNKIEDGSCELSLTTTWVGSNTYGYADGTGSAVQFVNSGAYAIGPTIVDSQGNVFLANAMGHRIRKVDVSNMVSTFVGDGVNTNVDGVGTAARINTPSSIAIDAANNLYVSAYGPLRKITSTGVTTTLTGSAGSVKGVDQAGNIWTTGDGCVTKLAPNGTLLITIGTCGTYGYADGSASAALFGSLLSGALDEDGTFYVADRNNNRIRKVTSGGTVSTYFGSGASSGNNVPIDGLSSTATLNESRHIAVDATGAVWITTKNNFMYLRRISPDGTTITTLGGIQDGTSATRLILPEPAYLSIDNKRGFIYVTGLSGYIWRVEL